MGGVDPRTGHACIDECPGELRIGRGFGRQRDHDVHRGGIRHVGRTSLGGHAGRAEERRRPGVEDLAGLGEGERGVERDGLRRVAAGSLEVTDHPMQVLENVGLDAPQRGEGHRGKRGVEVAEVVSAQRQVVEEVSGALGVLGVDEADVVEHRRLGLLECQAVIPKVQESTQTLAWRGGQVHRTAMVRRSGAHSKPLRQRPSVGNSFVAGGLRNAHGVIAPQPLTEGGTGRRDGVGPGRQSDRRVSRVGVQRHGLQSRRTRRTNEQSLISRKFPPAIRLTFVKLSSSTFQRGCHSVLDEDA